MSSLFMAIIIGVPFFMLWYVCVRALWRWIKRK